MHDANQRAAIPCPGCDALFVPKAGWQRFCSRTCRTGYAHYHGLTGKVKSVRRLSAGRVSVVLHFEAHDAARALAIKPDDSIMVVK